MIPASHKASRDLKASFRNAQASIDPDLQVEMPKVLEAASIQLHVNEWILLLQPSKVAVRSLVFLPKRKNTKLPSLLLRFSLVFAIFLPFFLAFSWSKPHQPDLRKLRASRTSSMTSSAKLHSCRSSASLQSRWRRTSTGPVAAWSLALRWGGGVFGFFLVFFGVFSGAFSMGLLDEMSRCTCF